MIVEWSRERIDEARLALTLLTRLPVGRLDPAPQLGDAVWAYPLTGAVVGAIIGTAFALARAFGLAELPASIIAVTAGVLVTGGMHEDGLADLADGFGGGSSRKRKLEIMGDSRLGSYGAIALVLSLSLKVTLMAQSLRGYNPLDLAIGVAAMSRAGLPAVMLLVPAARDAGLGRSAARQIEPLRVIAGVALGTAIGLLTLPFVWSVIGVMGIGILIVALSSLRQIGGFTGDVLGAAQIIAEIGGWVVLAASR